MKISNQQISNNYNLVKQVSIIVVVAGHYFGGLMWIPTTIALFVFGFSSGYFTEKKYSFPEKYIAFWKPKLVRIGVSLLFIDLFLFLLFLFQQKPGIWTWQTVLSMTGLSGFLTWFHLGNPSPFGNGLWFLTLLFIFYVSFPFVSSIMKKQRGEIWFLGVLLLCIFLEYLRPMGHMLWFTAFAFVSGVFLENKVLHDQFHVSSINLILLLIALIAGFIIINIYFSINKFNIIFLFAISQILVAIILQVPIADMFEKYLKTGGIFLEIYILHPYLLIKSNDNPTIVMFCFSLVIIFCISFFLKKFSVLFKNFVLLN